MLFFCVGLTSSNASSNTKFIKGSNPLKIPMTVRLPFNFTEITKKTKVNQNIHVIKRNIVKSKQEGRLTMISIFTKVFFNSIY